MLSDTCPIDVDPPDTERLLMKSILKIFLLLAILLPMGSGAFAAPSIVAPASGTQLAGPTLSATWSDDGVSVTGWWIYAGSIAGSANYANSGLLSAGSTSHTISGLPQNGTQVHVRLWYRPAGQGWLHTDHVYTAFQSNATPVIVQPSAGSLISGGQQTFQWSPDGVSVLSWWLYVGTSNGSRNLFDSGSINAATLSTVVSGLPQDGSMIHVRLWYRTASGGWQYTDEPFSTENTVLSPALISPVAGATLDRFGQQQFEWSLGDGNPDYWLYAGSTAAARDLFDSGLIPAGQTTITVSQLPTDGSDVYIRLWYRLPQGSWNHLDMVYQAHLSVPNNLANYDLVFSDEFNGAGLDNSKWNTGFLWGPYLPINNEEQLYVDTLGMHQNYIYDPFVFNGSTLKITASPVSTATPAPVQPAENDPAWDGLLEYRYNENYDPANVNYLSGLITSYESFQFAHGYIEARLKLPPGQGLWPAFWLLNAFYVEDSPEIDIVEFLGQNVNEVYHTYHYFDTQNGWTQISTPTYVTTGSTYTSAFHTYGVAWEPKQITWYVDGIEVQRIDRNDYVISTQSMYILANLAVGGNWPGAPDANTPFPAELEIDYIRAYRKRQVEPVTAAVLASDYQLMFADEFNGNSLDSRKWETSHLWGPFLPINAELQYYVDSNGADSSATYSPFVVNNGTLKIVAEAASANPTVVPSVLPPLNDPIWIDFPGYSQNANYTPPAYTSGIISSREAFKFVHGYIEMRAHIPEGDGLWPAFWLLNRYYVGAQPEIDILEVRGENPSEAVHSYHYSNSIGQLVSQSFTTNGGSGSSGYADGFHTYGVAWAPDKITWYIDGVPVQTLLDQNASTQLMYIIANLAVGGNFNTVPLDPSVLPAQLEIDYIRAYQQIESD